MKHSVLGHTDVVPPSETDLACIDRQLALLLAIRDDLADLRRMLAGRVIKSHLTVDEVAEVVGRAPYTVRSWIREGRVAAVRVSGTGPKGRLLVPRDELRKLVFLGAELSADPAQAP